MKKYLVVGAVIFLVVSKFNVNAVEKGKIQEKIKGKEFTYQVNPETFEIFFENNGVKTSVGKGTEKREVADFKEEENKTSWHYSKDGIWVSLKKEKEYLSVEIEAEKTGVFSWPKVEGESYYLPMGEGKFIPKADKNWKKLLGEEFYNTAESFSMQFFSVNKKSFSIVYIIENMFNNEISFDSRNDINFTFNHKFTSVNKVKKYGFRIYLTDINPVNIAKIYKNYIVEKGKFTTLEEKMKTDKNIGKLFGAPHIYLWGQEFIHKDNIVWAKFVNEPVKELKEAILLYASEGKEVSKELEKLKNQGYTDEYQKNIVTKAINEVMLNEKFSPKNGENLNKVETFKNNKLYLKELLGDTVEPVEKWGNGNSVELLKEMKNRGLDKAWLGFDGWETGEMNPYFVDYAKDNGYLIGTYDSYHSIHKKGEEKWSTAAFDDGSLYENATITNNWGEKITGFQGIGRKLNPALTFDVVNGRVDKILKEGVSYNSWFIDCDAAGELYDDYSKGTTQKEDMEARLKRMALIRDKGLVIGSELGNDYSSQTIAFAHGLETPVFGWGDKEMNDKNSKYFIGRYYAPKGGVPQVFSKEAMIKDLYKKTVFSPEYSIPLFKLVYNDSVITTHHWMYGSLKFPQEVKNRRLREILYNVPPLYHIDKDMREKYGNDIISFHKIWSDFHKKAVVEEMTNFENLTEDKMIQMTQFGQKLKVVANFSDKSYDYNGDVIKGQSLIIYEGNRKIYF